MIILGAGLSGLLCGAINRDSLIFEKSRSQPETHQSLLRLKSDSISHFTGIEMRKVKVYKSLWSEYKEQPISIRLAHQYSQKVTGKITARSIFNLDPEIRYIPPVDFVTKLAAQTSDIRYGKTVVKITKDHIHFENGTQIDRAGEPIVSTLPMPVMYGLICGYESNIVYPTKRVVINRYTIDNADSFATIYYPDPNQSIYRATLNGNILIIESDSALIEKELGAVLASFGIEGCTLKIDTANHHQIHGKIAALEDQQFRREFIFNSTINYNVYALGRFATWRPEVVQDDVLQDIFQIRRMISDGNYAVNHYQQER